MVAAVVKKWKGIPCLLHLCGTVKSWQLTYYELAAGTFALLSMLYRNQQDVRAFFLFCFIVQNILWDSVIYGDKKKKKKFT